MSLLSQEQSRRGFPVHQRVNGELVTRLPAGGAAIAGISGVWLEYGEDKLVAIRPMRVANERETERNVRYGVLQLPATQTIADGDQWLIPNDPVPWSVCQPPVVSGGVVSLRLRREDLDFTKGPNRTGTL